MVGAFIELMRDFVQARPDLFDAVISAGPRRPARPAR
jgi:hypothetical protein